jgi:DNA (cytosine-5)-methyltransferase 1
LDWGFHKEGFEVALALDVSNAAIQTHRANFGLNRAESADLLEIGPDGVVSRLLKRLPMGSKIGVIGGPPCQGFSRANTSSTADDPRNKLVKLYLNIVAALQKKYDVEFVVFENVLGIRDSKHAGTYSAIKGGLSRLGFEVTEHELCATDFGVAQKRKRIVLAGMRSGQKYLAFRPHKRKGKATVREAIEGLVPPIFFSRALDPSRFPLHPNHWTMRPKSPRFATPEISRSDGRSFKRLDWDKPSPTIAFGHREIHVHPDGTRRLSIFEAMRLQGFPDSFVLKGNLSDQVEQVSNAVPPPLAKRIAAAVRRSLRTR